MYVYVNIINKFERVKSNFSILIVPKTKAFRCKPYCFTRPVSKAVRNYSLWDER